MWQQQTSRTRAKRGWTIHTFWAAWLILAASAIVAAGMIETTPLIAVWAVAAAAGLVSGLLLGWRALSRWSLARAMGTPVAVAVPLAVLGLGFSETEENVAALAGGLASLFGLWEASTLAGYALISQRSREETVGAPITITLDRELETATAGATIPVVIREYVDDDDGRRHLARDTDSLSAHGYHVVSVEHTSTGSALADIFSGGSTYELQIVATFRLGAPEG